MTTTLVEGVGRTKALAEEAHRLVARHQRRVRREDINLLSAVVRSVAGCLHAVGLLAQDLEDDGRAVDRSDKHNLHYLAECTRVLQRLIAPLKLGTGVNGTAVSSSESASQNGVGAGHITVPPARPWPFTESETDALRVELEEVGSTLSFALFSRTDRTAAEQLSDLSKDQTPDIVDKVDASSYLGLDVLRVPTERPECYNKEHPCSIVEQEEYRAYLFQQRTPGTCDWFAEGDAYRHWLQIGDGSRNLCITGLAGAGKSVLASVLVNRIIRDIAIPKRPSVGVASFFCTSRDQRTMFVNELFHEMVAQLVPQNAKAMRHIKSLSPTYGVYHTQGRDIWRLSPPPARRKLMEEILAFFDATYLIVDGIDETTWSGCFVELLTNLSVAAKEQGTELHILILYRLPPGPGPFPGLEDWPTVNYAPREKDIALFLDSKLSGLDSDARTKLGEAVRIAQEGCSRK